MRKRAQTKGFTDKVRASRDGHEYHEVWTARRAMQLLWPESNLAAIGVEGFSPADQHQASTEASEIADIVLYYGDTTFERSKRTTIAQFKYSVAKSAEEFRAADAKKTVTKFAKAYKDFLERHGKEAVSEKLDFELTTNRPFYPPLLHALEALGKGIPAEGEIGSQANQFKAASGITGALLADFSRKCKFVGLTKNLNCTKAELAGVIVDWSATTDPLAAARLGHLTQMVRDKAGSAGANQNLIRRTDILAAFEVSDEDELLPCKPALAEVGKIVKREQITDVLSLIQGLREPLLVHAAGGVGKTVFMTSLASAESDNSEVVFFDCFGGGAYRSPADARHLPKRGLVHIANTLAFRGLCDPILPGSTDVESLFSTFRRRLVQCVNTLNTATPGRGITLFLDAIDNAALIADDRSEPAFPTRLLELIHHDPIPGVTLIVSCRTDRKPSTYARHKELELQPFNLRETGIYLASRLKRVSQVEIKVAQARSGGNPRVLEYLVKGGRGVLDESEVNKEVVLSDLIQQRITDALSTAVERGYAQEDINAFLAGLAVLPPPVPIDEYAGANGLEPSTVESFASDLRPLLERTSQGLMFRDEPTETLVRERYASLPNALHRVANNLLVRQNVSVYAARALPDLLHMLGDGEQLFRLAFDERVPSTITSTVGKRNIRYARIRAAVLHAAIKRDHNHLVRLLVELSSIAAVDQRGEKYILDCPDLVVAAQDIDATRRLFEARTGWPGTRHARLAIANTLAGQTEDATRHAIKTQEWIDHFFQQKERNLRSDEPRPERQDIAAIPLFLLCEGKTESAVNVLAGWLDWYSYEVCECVFRHYQLAADKRKILPRTLTKFVDSLTSIGPLAAALSFNDFSTDRKKRLVIRLAQSCKGTKKLNLPNTFRRERPNELQDGLRTAAAIALSLGLNKEALSILSRVPARPPSLWTLRDRFFFDGMEVFPFVFQVALVAAAKTRQVHEKDVIPSELVSVCSGISRRLNRKIFQERVKAKLPEFVRKSPDAVGERPEPGTLSADQAQQAERFLGGQLQALLKLTQALSDFLSASRRSVDKAFVTLVESWEETRKIKEPYESQAFSNIFSLVGFETAFFALRVRSELKPSSVKRFLSAMHSQAVKANTFVQVVSVLAQRSPLHELAGEQAVRARTMIGAEDDVTYRASLLSDLGRAMLPTSIDDAAAYFRDGLEQMDAIGSGDQEFTNELVIFASTMKGEELNESDFHTLTNICELNMGGDPEKFFWGAFSSGLSRAAGPRVLAKLSRWDDRSKIDLEHTLLPYLTTLVLDEKMEAEIALALNRLAKPVEYSHYGTKQFADVIRRKTGTRQDLVSELIQQYEDDYPGFFSDWTLEGLAPLAEETFGKSSDTSEYLSAALRRFTEARITSNDHNNYRGTSDVESLKRVDDEKNSDRLLLQSVTNAANPSDLGSLVEAIRALNSLHHAYDTKGDFFLSLRGKVPFGERMTYIHNICTLEHLNLYWKLEELKKCKENWTSSSAALGDTLRSQAKSLVRLHVDDLISFDRLSGFHLKEIAELTGVSIAELAIELIQIFSRPDLSVSGAVWLALASLIGSEADEGQGQQALTRLLRSDAAKLADSVADGPWEKGLYPENDVREIAAGLIWRMLGSPYAESRWRASHSLRCLARFGRWEIIDLVVRRLHSEETAGPFQARELGFYFLHARLWLLIALARMALDYPKEVRRYKDELLCVAMEQHAPHVLMRHFAKRALLACVDSGDLELPSASIMLLRNVDESPHDRLNERIRQGSGFYEGRPRTSAKPTFEFFLDMDFRKNDVDSLARVFGKSLWELDDLMVQIVHRLDSTVSSMYEAGGRDSKYRNRRGGGLTIGHHTYGQQLGWHALFFAAGTLLRDAPVTDDSWYEDDPWGEWLGNYILTREDGYWLSDGIDRLPLDTAVTLLEKDKEGLSLTGDREKLLQLVGITQSIGQELVVEGAWRSADDIEVEIFSALVAPGKAYRLARRLTREEPMAVWLPKHYEGEEGTEYLRTDKKEYIPWIFVPKGEAKLDSRDPFGAPCANLRPCVAHRYASSFSLSTNDRFGRMWKDKEESIVARAQAWGRENNDGEGGPYPGLRLLCSTSFIKSALEAFRKDLLVLIKLTRYQSESYSSSSKYTHTVAVIRIPKTLDFEYLEGPINHLHVWRY